MIIGNASDALAKLIITVLAMSEFVRRQLRQRLDSLRLAGVEFLPRCDERLASAAGETAANREVPSPITKEPAVPAPLETRRPELLVPTPPAEHGEHKGPSVESRRQELLVLAKQVAQCKRCPELVSTRTQTVFGVGAVDPELCFIGEAPGADEDRQGEPFVGVSGQLLNRIIAAMGMKREEVFICNVLRCRPPGNRPPKQDEADHCREYLERTLELVRPKFICTLGVPASQNLLRSTLSLTRLRGRFHDYQGIPVICTFHPSALLRDPTKKKDAWEDMKMLLAKMGREPPAAGKKADQSV
jgi:uracil-DNA glycosylase